MYLLFLMIGVICVLLTIILYSLKVVSEFLNFWGPLAWGCAHIIDTSVFSEYCKNTSSISHLYPFIYLFLFFLQCQNQPSPLAPSHSPPLTPCPPALAQSPLHPPVPEQVGALPKSFLVAGTMQSSGLLWPTDSPPPLPLEAKPPSSSDTCLEKFHQGFAASRTIKCY